LLPYPYVFLLNIYECFENMLALRGKGHERKYKHEKSDPALAPLREMWISTESVKNLKKVNNRAQEIADSTAVINRIALDLNGMTDK